MVSQRRVGVVLGYANILTKNLVNLVYTPMMLSFVGQADYGVYQACYSFVFSLTLLSFGFSGAYLRFYTQRQTHNNDEGIRRLNGVYLVLYSIISCAALLLGLLFSANAGTIFSAGFSSEQIAVAQSVIAILSASIAITLFNSVFDAYVLAHEEFRFQQTRQLLTTIATPFVAYGLLCSGFGVTGVAFSQLLVNVTLLLLNASFSIGRLGMRFDTRHFESKLFKSIAIFSTWIFANQVCELVIQNVPNIMLGALSGAVAVSVFSVSVQIRSVFYSLSVTMSNVFVPKINQIVAASNDNRELTDLMTRVGRYQAMLYMWVLGGFVLLGRFFMEAWAGKAFLDAYWLVIAMVVPLFIPLVQNTGVEIQRAKNMHKARSVCYLIMAFLNLIITALLSPQVGYWAPVVGYDVYVVLGTGFFMNWYYQNRVGLDMHHFWQSVLPVVAVGSLTTVTLYIGTCLLPISSWVSFLVWGAVYTFIYLVLTIVLVFTQDERATMWRKLHGRYFTEGKGRR